MTLTTVAAAALPTSVSAAPAAKVDKKVLAEIAQKGSAQFLVYLKERADLSKAAAQPSNAARTTYVYQQLTGTARRSQSSLTAMLKQQNVAHRPFWITNAVAVTGDLKLLENIAARADVASIDALGVRKLIEPVRQQPAGNTVNAVEWNVNNVEAPRVWSEFGVRGEGVVVANIDTGVQYNHPALVGKYRGNLGGGSFDHNYNWFDPSNVCGNPSLAPCDNNGHGTHTMGTMVGDDGAGNQIGVAPGAQWVAVKGCEALGNLGCSDAALMAAGEWVIAPTDLAGQNPRPDLAPDIVNNSWGTEDVGGLTFYQETLRAWIAAGIMPVFAIGNDGPACDTARSPGDNPEAYAVGAYDINNQIASFSSRGESVLGNAVKPNIAAPGDNVRSSINDGGYRSVSGTSMAAPHVSATVALVWSASPALRGDIAATRALLDNTAVDTDSLNCGGTVDFNNNFGEGRLSAYQAVLAAPRGAAGRVVGVVTDAATGAPIAGATVASGQQTALTGVDGRYSLTVSAGEQTITASKFGYGTESATVTVPEGGVVTQDFALDRQPSVTVTGRVLDGSGHNWPLYARLEVAGRPGGPVFTNPVTGAFSFDVPGNATYTVTVTSEYPGYERRVVEIAVGSSDVTADITLRVTEACTARGYRINAPLNETFDSGTTPAGWSVVRRSANGHAWAFDDPGERGNLTGGSGGFAIADSDVVGSGTTTDTDLITPPIDLSSETAPVLRFNSDFRDVGSEDFADVDVSTDGGTTWTNVWHQEVSRRGPVVEEVPLTAYAGQTNVRLRFHYFGTWDWWWQVDNVTLGTRTCDPVPGGLVVGFTTDANTGAPLNGVTVTSNDAPADRGVSVATPDDPNLPDGFYSLFSSLTGARAFTASKWPYQPETRTVTVVADAVVRADFALRASRLTVTPTRIESFQTLGQTRSTTITIANTGSAPAQVELLERPGDFRILSQPGAPEQTITVPGGVPKELALKGPRGITRLSGVPNAADAWRQIDNTPVPISDNVAVFLNGKVYSFGGGFDDGQQGAAMVYDIATEDWTVLPDLPTPRVKPQAVALKNKLYVFGGLDTDLEPVDTVDVFDPATGAWSTLTNRNPAPRAAAGAAVVNGIAYIVGGCADSSCAASVETTRFDPNTETFRAVAPYPHDVAWGACGGIGARVYCAGGLSASVFDDGFSYDPAANAWSPIADMPIGLWASQEAASGGLLVLAGGATNGSAALTNRTIAYDPATNAWRDLPNANFPRARGAGACGVFKIGGWVSTFTPSPQAEVLDGVGLCGTGEVPWLSENPQTFTLEPGARRTVTVTLSATAEAGVHQPGDYTAQIVARVDTPYPVPAVDVTMHVLPPANWGKVSGSIQGQSCNGNLVAVQAQVQINSVANPDLGHSLLANADGTYVIWLPRGRYDVIVSKDGWVAQVKRHRVDAGFAGTLDFTLRPFGGCNERAGGV